MFKHLLILTTSVCVILALGGATSSPTAQEGSYPTLNEYSSPGNLRFSECMHPDATNPLSIFGPEHLEGDPDQGLPQDTYEYVAIGGIPPYTWQVEGAGVSFTTTPQDNAMVTVGPNACGSFTVTVTAGRCAQRAQKTARSSAGKPHYVESSGSIWCNSFASKICWLMIMAMTRGRVNFLSREKSFDLMGD
jgi:hypothetical protein